MTSVTRRSVLKLVAAGLATGLLIGTPASHASPELAKRLLAAVPSHGERSLGDPDAPVVMVEYASATCSHCAEFHVEVWPGIKNDFVDTGKLRYVFREFPLEKPALAAFMLARCVPEDKYFATIDLIFRRQATWRQNPKIGLFNIVAMAGLGAREAEACLLREDLGRAIFDVTQKANKDFGVTSTPAFFVNGVRMDGHGDAAALRKAIETALAQAGGP